MSLLSLEILTVAQGYVPAARLRQEQWLPWPRGLAV